MGDLLGSGMAHLVRNRMFIDTVVNDVDEFLATFKFECKVISASTACLSVSHQK